MSFGDPTITFRPERDSPEFDRQHADPKAQHQPCSGRAIEETAMSLPWILIIVLGPLVAAYLASFVVEALRVALPLPEALIWAPNIAVQFVDAVGAKLRYIKTGSEPNVVLLHTLRPQLELFERVVPDLAKDFTVFALEYPGHGYSYIPAARYDADFFVRSVESFLDALDLHEATLCGVSIGGSI